MAFRSIPEAHFEYHSSYNAYSSPVYWNDIPEYRDQWVDRASLACDPTQVPINRYLGERDGPAPLFRAHLNPVLAPFPNLELDSPPHPAFYGQEQYPVRYPSPTDSGQSSAYHCSDASDRRGSPCLSPYLANAGRLPEALYFSPSEVGSGIHPNHDRITSIDEECVTLHDVQGYADEQPEVVRFEDETNSFATPQEGFAPMKQEPGGSSPVHNEVNGVANGTESTRCNGNSPPESPNIRRRRPTAARSPTSTVAKVTKRPTARRNSSFSKTNGHKNHSYCPSVSNRAFPCPFAIYDCDAIFGAKNEWKRHVNTQHMQTHYWRCDQCDQSEKKPNDFNRKDLFIQHVRRMHPLEKPAKTKPNPSRPAKNDPEERELNAIASRCFIHIRDPPTECSCLVCDARFTGDGAWDERLEHIGKHWEALKKENEEPNEPRDWREDRVLHKLLNQEGIIAQEHKSKRWILA